MERLYKCTLLVSLLCFGAIIGAEKASALTYSSDVNVQFTFNPTLSVNLSSNNLVISNLAPGTASDSNIITVNVKTNNVTGYTINATVGNNTTFNTRDLKHENSNIVNKFTSVNFGTIVATNTALTDNTWGYSYSLDNGSTWIANTASSTSAGYSGLPLYSDGTNIATLKESTALPATPNGDDIKFKIAARASYEQSSGEYNNVINFTTVANPLPGTLEMAFENAGKKRLLGYFKLQDMTPGICSSADIIDEGSQMQAIDIRDNKVYWIAKLRDGKCWMTQNLDLDLDSNREYTHTDTDLGYGNSVNNTWTPNRSTYPAGSTAWSAAESNENDFGIQQSYDPGEIIWDGVYNENVDLDSLTQGTDTHYHIGNYYNWNSAVAMNDARGQISNNVNVDQSICPAGWSLPEDFYSLFAQYGTPYEIGQTAWNKPLYFTLGGTWNGTSSNVAHVADYWTPKPYSISFGMSNALIIFGNNNTYPGDGALRGAFGASVRCVAR